MAMTSYVGIKKQHFHCAFMEGRIHIVAGYNSLGFGCQTIIQKLLGDITWNTSMNQAVGVTNFEFSNG